MGKVLKVAYARQNTRFKDGSNKPIWHDEALVQTVKSKAHAEEQQYVFLT